MTEAHKNLHKKISSLSQRQQEVLLGLLQGRTDSEIADALGISSAAVRKHLQKAAEGLGLRHEGEQRRSHRSELLQLPITPEDLLAVMAGEKVKPRDTSSTEPPVMLTGLVPLDSPLYLEREADEFCKQALTADYSGEGSRPFIRIKGSQGMGKSSLLVRLRHFLETEQRQVVGFVDLNSIDFSPEAFTDLDLLLRQFTAAIAQTFKNSLKKHSFDVLKDLPNLQEYWKQPEAGGLKSSNYLNDYIFSKISEQPKTLLIDGIDEVLGRPTQEPFFRVLRSWNEIKLKKVSNAPLSWPSFVIAYSTDPYPEYGIIGSVLNQIGTPIQLQDFNPKQIQELAKKYGRSLTQDEINYLYKLIGGHPTLINRSLYKMIGEGMTLTELDSQAVRIDGPFSDYLLENLDLLKNSASSISALSKCFLKIINGEDCKDEFAIFQLNKAGLIKINDSGVSVRCELYQRYFKKHLQVADEQ